VVVASAKLAVRTLFAATLLLIALLLFAGRAHADETATPTPTPEAATAPPPESVSGPAPAEPTPATPADPPPPAENSAPPPTDTSGTPAPAPQDQSSNPPSAPAAEPTPPTPAGAPGPNDPPAPNNTNNQNAGVDTNGTAVGNTGGNAAGAHTNSGTKTNGTKNNGSATGAVKSGDASAIGGNSNSAIGQQVNASTTGLGRVDILQIALVVNVGVAHANSGQNVAGAGGHGISGIGTVKSGIKTGNATALGNNSKTSVKQAATIKNGEQSNQKAVVVNVGIALGNSGLNITIGTLGSDGNPVSTQAVKSGSSNGQIYTGDANALGDRSNSKISQVANGKASGVATLIIDQRAVIVNFGTALANSGGNVALASFDASQLTSEEAQIIYAVLNALAPLFGQVAPPADAQNSLGGTKASIDTGDANAIGNASSTNISQEVNGEVKGDGYATAKQTAIVGNLGVALANTGFNGAVAGVTIDGLVQAHPELLTASNSLAQFLNLLTNLSWLDSENPFASFSQSVDLGGVVLNLGGSITGDTFLLGWDSAIAPDGGPLPGGVRVRQISGVLNIGFATANTGHNTVVAIVTGTNDALGTIGKTGSSAKSATKVKSGSPDVLAEIFTGNALAIGNNAVVRVCQTFHDSVDCSDPKPDKPKPDPKPQPKPDPKPEPNPPSEPPVVIVSANEELPPASPTAATPGSEEQLPFTGADPQALIAIAGGMLAAGAALSSRRRRERA
jgi:LPXTG-motif cell wall-anchored protein